MKSKRNMFLLIRINDEEREQIQARMELVWVALDDVLRKLAVIE